MNILNAEHVEKTFEDKRLLKGIVLGIGDTDKIGVVGVNGCGKSTLLSVIAGELEPDAGEVVRNRNLRISYLPQDPKFDENCTLLENVVGQIGGKAEHWDVAGEAKAMLLRFGLADPTARPGELSGGQRKRAALVAALLTPAELLILDEPTNHLDHAMIEYLQVYLQKYQGALLLVTHDRYFLDQVTKEIVELDDGKLYRYETNYSGYLELRAARFDDALARERKMAALYRQDLKWMRRGARARSTKNKAHIQRFEELRDREKIIEQKAMEMESLSTRLGRTTIEIKGISKSYGEKHLFSDFTYTFGRYERVGIVGPNGCGKSTLLKAIIGEVEPDAGEVVIGQTVRIGYFGQEHESLPEDMRLIDVVRDSGEYVETKNGLVTASKMCENFLFDGNTQYTPVGKLSGGEKRRLTLLRTLMKAPNVLILDEPTNDLDIATLRVLEDYLDSFAGIVIVVSHDRYFLDRVVTRILSFENGAIYQSEGGYEDYRKRTYATLEGQAIGAKTKDANEKKSSEESWKKPRKKKKLSYSEQREHDMLPGKIDELQERVDALDAQILENANSYMKLAELSAEKEKLEEELLEKMDRFVQLEDLAVELAKEE
ncbi:ATP-binding cassette, subfamily F, uup [Lachnospiraceae bacterium XBB1006]|nr:ATP-binding cassette, subfamily F, uup [Lachnospiraceae bacterium XBB1006]